MNLINRRHFLKHASLGTGSLALTPLARSLRATIRAADEGKSPLRFVFFLQGNGIYPRHIQPEEIEFPEQPERLTDLPLDGRPLPPAIDQFEPFKDRLTILQGLSGRVTGPPLHSADFGALGCYSTRAKVFAETIDGALAKKLPGIFPHVGLAVSARADDFVLHNVSALDRNKSLPSQCQPGLAFERLFASATSGDARKAFDARTNVLDFLAEDVRQLRPELNPAERDKLDFYLGAFESMAARQAELARAAANIAASRDHMDPSKFPSGAGGFDHLDAHFDLAASALIAGLTNVLTVSSGSGMEFTELIIDGRDLGFAPGAVHLHGIGHGASYCGQPWEKLQVAVQRRHVRSLVGFLRKLDSVPEGNGTVLDNTVVVYMSDMAEGHHPECKEWPVLLIGNLAGRLKSGGRYLRYPWYQKDGHRTIANLFTSLLHAAGHPRDRFGFEDQLLLDLDQGGPLEELST